MRRIGVLTSGGDCSGMNAAVRAVVRGALGQGLEVVGFHKGYRGLLEGHGEAMTTRAVSGMLQRGGTVLQSARCLEMLEADGQDRALAQLDKLGVEGLVVIGGDGSLRGAHALSLAGVPVIGIPASIDNDLPFTDMSLGVDTALNNIVHAVDCLKDTASSHDRAFIVETMGRNCGYLAVASAVACGAEFALIPEHPQDLEDVCTVLLRRYREGRDNSLVMVAEGVGRAQDIADRIKDRVGFETRIMVLGHYQRGGAPSVFDRLLGARFGVGAVEALQSGQRGMMAGLSCGRLVFTELEKVLDADPRPIDPALLQLATLLGT